MASNTTHTLYLFTDVGMAATAPVQLLPQSEDPQQGGVVTALCSLTIEDQITCALSLSPGLEAGYLVAITELGEVKRLSLEDLPGMSAHPFKFMDVEDGDRLLWVGYVDDDSQVVLVTFQGQAIRFAVSDVRPTGLGAGGMRAVKLLGQRDRVVGAAVVDERANVWVCTDTGVAKSTPLTEYPVQGRGGQGVITMKLPKDAAGLTAATAGRIDDNIVVVTDKRKPKYMRVGLAAQGGRNTRGDYVISMSETDAVARVVRLEPRIAVPDVARPAKASSGTDQRDGMDFEDEYDVRDDDELTEDDE